MTKMTPDLCNLNLLLHISAPDSDTLCLMCLTRNRIPCPPAAACKDDPMGYVAADPHKSCSLVDAVGGWWRCDDLDPDFNGVKDIYVWELCPKSCNMCA
jgi:hypothetical protein